MAVSAMLRATAVTVAPGASARCHVLIRNTAGVVDQFGFTVMGGVADWTDVKPARVNLLPNQEVTVELTFSPPRSFEVLAGEHPFALKVTSREDPHGSVVQEGAVTVTKFVEVEADIVPKTSEGRRKGRHTLAIDNLGNYTHGVDVLASDPDNKLTFKIKPRSPQLAPGTATFVKVIARPKKYFWKGPNRLLPFVVKILLPAAAPMEIEATFDQKALLPKRLFWLLGMLLALLFFLFLMITLLLRQRPVSIAGPAPTAPSTTTRTVTATSPSPSVVSSAPTTRPTTSRSAAGGGGGGSRPSGSRPSTVQTTFVIQATAYPGVAGGPQLFSFVVPEERLYRVTSVVLRNTNGDVGDLEIRYDDDVLGRFDLAAIDAEEDPDNELSFRFTEPPDVPAGELVTLAVTCRNANPDAPCTPSGTFTATLLPPPS
jgi:hypothetical protein